MQFRIKNISEDNHRVEFKSKYPDTFALSKGEVKLGDVIVSPDGSHFNACLANFKGPDILCTGTLPTVTLKTTNFTGGLLHVNGTEYVIDASTDGDFFTAYQELALSNDSLNTVIEVTQSTTDPSICTFTARSSDGARVAITANDLTPSTWSQVIAGDIFNESVLIEDNVVRFCLMANYGYTIDVPTKVFTGIPFSVRLSIRYNDEIHLNAVVVKLTTTAENVNITTSSFHDNYIQWEVTPTELGVINLNVWCPFIVPEHQEITIEVAEAPTMNIEFPKLFDWTLLEEGIGWGARVKTQTFSDGTTVPANLITYTATTELTYPPYHRPPIQVSNGEIYSRDMGRSKLTASAYHDEAGWLEAAPRIVNIFGLRSIPSFDQVIPGTVVKTRVNIVIVDGTTEGEAILSGMPPGWSAELRHLNADDFTSDINDFVQVSLNPEDPLDIIVRAIDSREHYAAQFHYVLLNPNGEESYLLWFMVNMEQVFNLSQDVFFMPAGLEPTNPITTVKGVAHGGLIGSTVTIKTFDDESGETLKNTYTTTLQEQSRYSFDLPADAFSPAAEQPTVEITFIGSDGVRTYSSMHHCIPRMPLELRVRNNSHLGIFNRANNPLGILAGVKGDSSRIVSPNINTYTNMDELFVGPEDGDTTIEVYRHQPEKTKTQEQTIKICTLKDLSTTEEDLVAPSVIDVVKWGDFLTTGADKFVHFVGISSLVGVPDNIPSTFKTADSLFAGCGALNDPNLTKWKVGNIVNMWSMFHNCVSLNQDLSGWCVSQIATAPANFVEGAPLMTAEKLPVWGTCPNG